jgi:hypothetical protein
MRVFRTLGEALDMPGLRAVGALLAARTAQMLRAAVRYIEDEVEAGSLMQGNHTQSCHVNLIR